MEEQPIARSKGNLSRLLVKVREERGLDLAQYRDRYVERRVAVRLNNLGLHTYHQYANYLDAHPEEYAKLLDTLTINVTQFFRDTSVYALVRQQVIPAIIKTKTDRKQRLVRVWCAGCATGEEPYSLAMAFQDAIDRLGASHIVLSVIGTDIDRDALAFAKRGVYPVRELAQIPRSDRLRYVDTDGEHFRFKPEITRLVRFQHLNLFADAPIHGIDMVFCRNVFIYFTREEQERMIGVFDSSLVRGGFLVLGRSERLATAHSKAFELVSGRERIYRKPLRLL